MKEKPTCDNCRMRETCPAKGEICNDYSRAEPILPPPCERCGGSGEKFIGITGRTDPVYETCPTCKGSGLKPSPCETKKILICSKCKKEMMPGGGTICKTCRSQALAKTLRKHLDGLITSGWNKLKKDGYAVLTHLEAQAKQIEQLEDEKKGQMEWLIKIRKSDEIMEARRFANQALQEKGK